MMKMRKKWRNPVLVMLFLTVISPIVFYTDTLSFSFSSSDSDATATVPFATTDDDSALNDLGIDDVSSTASTLTLGVADSMKLNLLPQETSTTLKEPIGFVYSDNITSDSFSEDSQSLNSSIEHKTRVLSATDANDMPNNTIKQVTDELPDPHLVQETTPREPEIKQPARRYGRVTKEPAMMRPAKHSDAVVVHDAVVRKLKDQLISGKVYLSLTATKNNPHFVRELKLRMKDVQRALGDAMKDSDLPRNAHEKLKAMEQTLAKGKQIHDDCAAVTKKLRALLNSMEEQLRVHKKQTMFLTQITAKTLPKGLHCLPLRLSTEFYSLDSAKRDFPNHEKLEDPNLFHYALFSDNILATSVVVNSTVSRAKHPSRHVFHIVTDRLNYAAMKMWFLANPPGKATIQVQNVEEFTWLNSSYSPVLKQLGSPNMIDFYFKAHRANPDTNLKYRNPKYLSILNHLRFYLPEIFPKLNKVLFLDDDIVVQKDLTPLWALDMKGKVNGAVETCGESFHRFSHYLNFSNPLISKELDPHACGWAYGMNIFDLDAWKRNNITEVYHKWQRLNHDRRLWNLGTLPPGLITFWKQTFSLDKSWHVLGLGYNPSVDHKELERAAVIHYNGNMKPWLEIGLPKYKNYWTKFVDYDHIYLRECNINS